MKLFKMALIAMSAIIVAGCATDSPERQAKLAELQRTIPTCSSTEECNEKWEAAQLWVVKNSGWKIQIQSNVLIETYNSINHSPNIAVRVTKEPIGGGKYNLLVRVWCDNAFYCNPNTIDAALDFNRTVSLAGAK